jgi:hypothetical protein
VRLAKRPWTEEDNARLKEFVAQRRVNHPCRRRAPSQHSERPYTGAKARRSVSANAGFPQKVRRCDLRFLAPLLALIFGSNEHFCRFVVLLKTGVGVMRDGNEAKANLQDKLAQARRLLHQVSDPTTTESLRKFIADLENRLHITDPE